LLFGLYLRTSGTFRGLDVPYLFHPDETKQVTALHNYLEGHYVWFTGLLFYDGYPYGLNHVDEWILRPVFAVKNAILGTLYGTCAKPGIPGMDAMYYWARGLRILYGMMVLLVAWLIARRLFEKTGASWLAVTLAAIAPVSVCVSHFATGDIGVDLFGGIALLMLCLYAERTRSGYLFMAGLATGMAFGCKYNGLLLGIAIAIYLTLELIAEKRFKVFLGQCLNAGIACILGILITTPALLINFRQTRKDMFANFEFIKNYDVSHDLISKPLYEKAWLGLTQNTATIVSAFGWMVMALAVLGLIAGICKYWKQPGKGENTPEFARKARLLVALVSFPFLALLISLAGKLRVQPFHFSYLQVPFITCAVLGFAWMRQGAWKGSRFLALVCGIIAVSELGLESMKENFFWQREDTLSLERDIPRTVFTTQYPTAEDKIIKNVYLEDGGVSAFRNREHLVKSPAGLSWDLIQSAVIPTIPYPVDHEWIFLNGPVFPRNDRMFVVNNNEIIRRHLVLHEKPGQISVGFRTSAWPVHAAINLGNDCQSLQMNPNEQQILTFTPRKWRHYPGSGTQKEPFIIPLEIETMTGNLIVTVLDSKFERKRFALFGATATNYIDLLTNNVDTLAEDLRQTRYLEANQCNRQISAGNKKYSADFLLPSEGMLLPGGAYELECDIAGLAPTSTVSFLLADHRGAFGQFNAGETVSVVPGPQQITYRFTKTFAPYLCQVQILCTTGTCNIISWRLRPDVMKIAGDMKTWRDTGTAPLWTRRYPVQEPWTGQEWGRPEILFDKAISLKRFEYSSSVRRGQPLTVRCTIQPARFPYLAYDDIVMFFHLVDRNGKQAAALNLAVREVDTAASAGAFSTLTGTSELPPGTYDMWLGIWNGRTHNRLSFSGRNCTSDEKSKRRIHAGKVTITP